MPLGVTYLGKDPNGNDVFAISAKNNVGNTAPAHTLVDLDGQAVAPALDATVVGLSDKTGAVGDAPWDGTGDGSLISVMKAVAAALAAGIGTTDTNGAPFRSAIPMTVGAGAIAAGRSVEILCSADGTVTFDMAGGGTHQISIGASAYTQTFPYSVTGIAAATATATYANLS